MASWILTALFAGAYLSIRMAGGWLGWALLGAFLAVIFGGGWIVKGLALPEPMPELGADKPAQEVVTKTFALKIPSLGRRSAPADSETLAKRIALGD
jgi:hypothetical protein